MRCHAFLCLLAQYVAWHIMQALEPSGPVRNTVESKNEVAQRIRLSAPWELALSSGGTNFAPRSSIGGSPSNIDQDGEAQLTTGMVMDIQHFTNCRGPGIRTTVFLKGCALHCPWCFNAEGCHPQPEMLPSRHEMRAVAAIAPEPVPFPGQLAGRKSSQRGSCLSPTRQWGAPA